MTGYPAAALFYNIMNNQNNYNNHPESNEPEYRGRRFRDGGNDAYYEEEDNFDVTPKSTYRPRQNVQQGYYPPSQPQNYDRRAPQNYDYGQNYGTPRQQYPQGYGRNDGYGDGYDNINARRRPRIQYDEHYNEYYDDRRGNRRNQQSVRRKPQKKRTSTGIIVVRVIAILLLIAGLAIVGVKVYNYIDDKLSHNRLAALSQDLEQLYATNNDFFGWLKIEDTVVDYPVMHTPYENEKYLHMDFDGNYSESGELFMDAQCDPNGYHYLIYGHHMFNGSMFGSLPKYEDEGYFKEHSKIRFDTRSEQAEYEIFAVFYSKVYDDSEDVFKYYNCPNLNDEGTYNYYVENVKALSIYDTGITPQYGERIITLSTCNYHTDDGRFVVAARKIQ